LFFGASDVVDIIIYINKIEIGDKFIVQLMTYYRSSFSIL